VTTDDQRDVIAFLSAADAYGLRAGSVERIDTHISIVWLAGDRVFKLKRAVRFDYVDFSTIELRRAACGAVKTSPWADFLHHSAVSRGSCR
jgi:aminoglycoside phosphotransferase family enzyme